MPPNDNKIKGGSKSKRMIDLIVMQLPHDVLTCIRRAPLILRYNVQHVYLRRYTLSFLVCSARPYCFPGGFELELALGIVINNTEFLVFHQQVASSTPSFSTR